MTEDPLNREQSTKKAQAVRVAAIAAIGVELMNAWNRNKTDPSDMAVMGHDTSTGFEFVIERNGVTYNVDVRRDLDS